MNHQLISEDDLKDWIGVTTRSSLEGRLLELKIRYFKLKHGAICTTIDGINQALLDPQDDDDFI